jgi:hypothetical protein
MVTTRSQTHRARRANAEEYLFRMYGYFHDGYSISRRGYVDLHAATARTMRYYGRSSGVAYSERWAYLDDEMLAHFAREVCSSGMGGVEDEDGADGEVDGEDAAANRAEGETVEVGQPAMGSI